MKTFLKMLFAVIVALVPPSLAFADGVENTTVVSVDSSQESIDDSLPPDISNFYKILDLMTGCTLASVWSESITTTERGASHTTTVTYSSVGNWETKNSPRVSIPDLYNRPSYGPAYRLTKYRVCLATMIVTGDLFYREIDRRVYEGDFYEVILRHTSHDKKIFLWPKMLWDRSVDVPEITVFVLDLIEQ